MKKGIQIKASKKKNAKKAAIMLPDELSIFDIEDIKIELKEAFNKFDELELNAKEVKNIDLTFVQLLHSMVISAEEKNKKIQIDIELNEEVEKLFENTDLIRILKN